MSKLVASEYLRRVEVLLSDIDVEDRVAVLADIQGQLNEIPDGDPIEILGSPEDFVTEYRRSAGLPPSKAQPSPRTPPATTPSVEASVVAVMLLPIAALLLLSMGGGQFFFGPVAIAIGWMLSRRTYPLVRLAWSVMAGLLVGQMAYLLLGMTLGVSRLAPIALAFGLGVAAGAAILFWKATELPDHPPASGNGVAVAALFVGALGVVSFWMLAPIGRGNNTGTWLVLWAATIAVVALVAAIASGSKRHTH